MLLHAALVLALVGAARGRLAGGDGVCSPLQNNTLFYLQGSVDMLPLMNATACCVACSERETCKTWSYSGDKWTPETPCHLSSAKPLKTAAGAGFAGGENPGASSARFLVALSPSGARQTVLGVGYEIQSDSIGSDNNGLPNDTTSAPHSLLDSEQVRLAETLKGFRWCRLALGLFLRGLTPDNKHIVGRWPTQMSELKTMQDISGIEGFAPEYWSPAPYWKSTQSYLGGGLASFNASFLDEFGDACVTDLKYLEANGLKVAWWGLQNEPTFASANLTAAQCMADPSLLTPETPPLRDDYSGCHYSQCSYYVAAKAVIPKIKAAFPHVYVHANSARGQAGASPLVSDPVTRALIDGYSWHYVGASASVPFEQWKTIRAGLPPSAQVYDNEYEYQPGSQFAGTVAGFSNTARFFMNFLTFVGAQQLWWIHAAKPCSNSESAGYGLTYFRAPGETCVAPQTSGLEEGKFIINPYNFNAVAPFARFLPWNSVRHDVVEVDGALQSARIVAFRAPPTGMGGPLHTTTPEGALLLFMATDPGGSFTYNVTLDDGMPHTLTGYSFTADAYNTSLGVVTIAGNTSHAFTLAPAELQVWVE